MARTGRPRGGKNRTWAKEEKLRIVKRHLEEKVGHTRLAREEGISKGMLHGWIQKYLDGGEAALEKTRKTGNRFSALHTSKNLTEIERLKLTVVKQQVEIARLKNGYTAEGSGAGKVFAILDSANTKLSKK